MKAKATTTILTILFGFALGASLRAANRVVELGQDIQPKVAASQAGDVVIVREATFNSQTVVIDKPIRLVREKGTTVTIGGTITVRDLNATGVLRDFVVNATGGGLVKIENCKKYGLENLTGLPNGITIIGSKVVIRDCVSSNHLQISGASEVEVANSSFGNLTVTDSNVTMFDSNASTVVITGGKARFHHSKFGTTTFNRCDWEAHDSWFTGHLYSDNSHSKLFRSSVWSTFQHRSVSYQGEDLDCVVYQCFLRDQGYFYSKRTWVAYSLIGHAYPYGSGATEAHFVGNTFRYRLYPHGPSSNRLTNLNLYVRNNLFSTASKLPSDSLHTTSTSFTMTKKLTALQPSLVTHVRNELHTAECKVGFSYLDGTEANSTTQTQPDSGWGSWYRYENPNPSKLVTEIKVFLKRVSGHGAAYDQHTFINNTYSVSNFRVTFPATTTYDSHTLWVSSDHSAKLQSAHVFNNVFDNSGHNNKHLINLHHGTVNGAFIHGNVFRRDASWSAHAIHAPKGPDRFIGNSPVPAPDVCSYNYFQDSSKAVTGGLVNEENFSGADPGFIDLAAGDYRLKPDSILVDKGPDEPQFNDHNGSRNDVGLYGGHAYDSTGNVTTFPVVLSTWQSTNLISIGDTTPLTIKARAAVATD